MMDQSYKTETNESIEYGIDRVISEDIDESTAIRRSGKIRLPPNEIQRQRIPEELSMIHIKEDDAKIIQSLSKLLDFSNHNFFENILPIDIKRILELATFSRNVDGCGYDGFKCIDKISDIASKLLSSILKQPEVASIFYEEVGGIGVLKDYFPDTWGPL